ncbi:MAG: NAD(P)H-dependent flavin oxidoreductase [Acidimicrobiales bacterium]
MGTSQRHRLSPRLSGVLAIEAPIVQSGMAGVAGPELVSAVSEAGGLGVMAALRLPPDRVRLSIRRIREATRRPFGVNIWLHDDVRTSPDPASVPDDVVRGAQAVLNQFRPRFDLPPTLERPAPADDLVDAAIEVMIEERIPVFSTGLGVPEAELVERFHQVGSTVITMVATVEDGRAAVANGADVVVAQGREAGGHRSYGTKRARADAEGVSCLVLVPAMVDAIGAQVPVLASGGVVDGRGLAAMMALGADGVLLGTRFVATRESAAADLWKRRLTSGDRVTALTDGFTGQWARVLDTEFTDHWAASGAEALPGLLQASAGYDLFGAARRAGDDQLQPLYAGAAVGRLSDIPSAAEVVRRMVADAGALLGRWPADLSGPITEPG